MYRTRFDIWIFLLILAFLINSVPKMLSNIDLEAVEDVYTVYTEDVDMELVNAQSNLSVQVDNSGFNHQQTLKNINTKDNADIIIGNFNEDFNGYKKYEDFLYSPITLFAPSQVLDYPDGFSHSKGTYNSYGKDLKVILEAIENNKKYEDLGIDKHVLKGNIELYIPDQSNFYYETIVDVIYLTLNDGIMPTDTQKNELKSRVDNIIKKCKKVEDIASIIEAAYDNNENLLALAPEFIIANGNAFCSTQYNSYMPIYLNNTIAISYDVYIKENIKTSSNDEPLNYEIIDIFNTGHYIEQTGYRSINMQTAKFRNTKDVVKFEL